MFFDDALHDVQTEPATVLAFGGEKRRKQPAAHGFIHTRTGVVNAEQRGFAFYEFSTEDWQPLATGSGEPAQHGYSGELQLSAQGASLLSDCDYDSDSDGYRCAPEAGRFPRFSADGTWVVAGGTLRHLASGERRLLDATATVAIFALNGDVIAASADNSLTRYCRAN